MQYTVKGGDTLWGIAQRYLGSGARWKELGFGGDPRKLPIGYTLNIPGGGGPAASPPPQQQQQEQRRSEPAFDYEGLLRRQEEGRKAEQERLAKEQEGLFTGYETAAKAQPTLSSEYERLRTAEGIPEEEKDIAFYKGEIGKIKAGLNELETAIAERTKGQFVSEAQRARMVAQERGEFTTKLSRLQEAYAPTFERYTTKVGEVGTKLGLVKAEQEKALSPMQMRINAFGARYATEMTGYNEARKNELSLLLTKLQRDQTLTDREWQQAADLSKEEREWNRTKEKLALEASYKIKTSGTGTDTQKYYGKETAPTGEGLPTVPTGGGAGGMGPQTNYYASAFGRRLQPEYGYQVA